MDSHVQEPTSTLGVEVSTRIEPPLGPGKETPPGKTRTDYGGTWVTTRQRWPGWVYGGGEEPDYRFSFANERTFLAWIRTALAFLAAGVAVDVLELAIAEWLQRSLAVVLIILGLGCAVSSWLRWARAERAMRRGDSLPSSRFSAALTVVVVIVAVALLVTAL